MSLVCSINQNTNKVPQNPNQIQPPKPHYTRGSHTYQYDQNDTFYYDMINGEISKPAILITPYICGHSKSACVRRLANEFSQSGHSVYILLPRGSLDTKFSLECKKLRCEVIDSEDIDTLVGLIPNKQVILAGYSLGALNICYYMTKSQQIVNRSKVTKIIMSFIEFDLNYVLKLPIRIQKDIGSCIVPYVDNNREYFYKHGISKQSIDNIVKMSTVYQYDQEITIKTWKTQSVQEYYDIIAIIPMIQFIKVPALFISTADDIITGPLVPFEEMKKNNNVNAVVFNYGNHVGTVTSDGRDMVCQLINQWCQ
ncbi:Conserved_hypothetical protein [Hexamita inflata]|uniref:AB hydrolase-1 domain-containing protein n=1 Tax=Hexamita inflata TaxID=28002 RepID=A0AA86TP09_9EUKA|nr:Conserved hypothetical protein [Hexamita inflata]